MYSSPSCPSPPLYLPQIGPQRFVEIFAHNYMMGAESAVDLDFVFVAFQEADSNDVRVHHRGGHSGQQRRSGCLSSSQLMSSVSPSFL